jgi:hypothetical protein
MIFLITVISSGFLALAGEAGLIETTTASWLSGFITGMFCYYVLKRGL